MNNKLGKTCLCVAILALALAGCKNGSEDSDQKALLQAGKNLRAMAVVLKDNAPLFTTGANGLEQTGELPLGEALTLLDPKTYTGKKPPLKSFAYVSDSAGMTGWANRPDIAEKATVAVIYGQNLSFSIGKAITDTVRKPLVVALTGQKPDKSWVFSYYDAQSKTRHDKCVLNAGEVSMAADEVKAAVLLDQAERAATPEQKTSLIDSAQSAYPDSAVCAFVFPGQSGPAGGDDQYEALTCSFTVSADNAQMRANPSQSAEVLASIPNGEEVDVTERTTGQDTVNGISGHWYHASYMEDKGWIFGAELDGADSNEVDEGGGE